MSASKSNDYLLVFMVDPVQVGDTFQTWPLHLTLVPWFEAPGAENVVQVVRPILQRFKPFTVQVGTREHYGYKRSLPVMKIEPSAELQNLHKAVLEGLDKTGFEVKGRYIGDQYTPHVTQKVGRDAEGELHIDTIHIAEALPQGYRKIVGSIDLGAQ